MNCALWSTEVYEDDSGKLVGLPESLRRARSSVCADCGRCGATMQCANDACRRCSAVHFACALRRCPPAPQPCFTFDRSWFCSRRCHQAAAQQRLRDTVRSHQHSRTRNRKRWDDDEEDAEGDDEDEDGSSGLDSIDRKELAALEASVTDDLEVCSVILLVVLGWRFFS